MTMNMIKMEKSIMCLHGFAKEMSPNETNIPKVNPVGRFGSRGSDSSPRGNSEPASGAVVSSVAEGSVVAADVSKPGISWSEIELSKK